MVIDIAKRLFATGCSLPAHVFVASTPATPIELSPWSSEWEKLIVKAPIQFTLKIDVPVVAIHDPNLPANDIYGINSLKEWEKLTTGRVEYYPLNWIGGFAEVTNLETGKAVASIVQSYISNGEVNFLTYSNNNNNWNCGSWFMTTKCDNPKLHLFVLPGIFNIPADYEHWPILFDASIEIHIVQFPGRPPRLDEPAPTDLK
jgi:hypothetical protein